MINARFMYARPGNLFKEFIIEDNSQNYSIQDHIVTHTIVQSGPPKAKRTDRLILGERSFYICDVDEVGGLGFSTLYYAEERRDLQ